MNDVIISELSKILPTSLLALCRHYLAVYGDISEIRLRRNGYISFTKGKENIITSFVCDDGVFSQCTELIIGSSFYKTRNYITGGMLPLEGGLRVGICGTALSNNDGSVENVYDISSLSIRFPRSFEGCSEAITDRLLTLPYLKRGVLILAPPCCGKTTYLRDIALRLSTPPVAERVCVVDENFELEPLFIPQNAQLDILKGYPMEHGISIATRFLNPRYIICDEIGSEKDIRAILNATHSGVPFIASAHAASIEEFISKPDLSQLLDKGIFGTVAELVRQCDGKIKADITDLNTRKLENSLRNRDVGGM